MAFPITITGRHVEVTDALRDHTIEKMNHACRLLDKISAATSLKLSSRPTG